MNLIQEVYLLADIPHLPFPLFLLHLSYLLFVLYFSIILFFLPSSICDSTGHQNKHWEDFNFRRVNLLSITGRMSWAPAGNSILVWNVVGFFFVLKFRDIGRWGLWWGWQWDVPVWFLLRCLPCALRWLHIPAGLTLKASLQAPAVPYQRLSCLSYREQHFPFPSRASSSLLPLFFSIELISQHSCKLLISPTEYTVCMPLYPSI